MLHQGPSSRATENDSTSFLERKRDIVVLIMRFLYDYGFVSSYQSLCNEVCFSLNQIDTADNIDLWSIVQEYVDFFHIRYARYPKLVRHPYGGATAPPPEFRVGGISSFRPASPPMPEQHRTPCSNAGFGQPLLAAIQSQQRFGLGCNDNSHVLQGRAGNSASMLLGPSSLWSEGTGGKSFDLPLSSSQLARQAEAAPPPTLAMADKAAAIHMNKLGGRLDMGPGLCQDKVSLGEPLSLSLLNAAQQPQQQQPQPPPQQQQLNKHVVAQTTLQQLQLAQAQAQALASPNVPEREESDSGGNMFVALTTRVGKSERITQDDFCEILGRSPTSRPSQLLQFTQPRRTYSNRRSSNLTLTDTQEEALYALVGCSGVGWLIKNLNTATKDFLKQCFDIDKELLQLFFKNRAQKVKSRRTTQTVLVPGSGGSHQGHGGDGGAGSSGRGGGGGSVGGGGTDNENPDEEELCLHIAKRGRGPDK